MDLLKAILFTVLGLVIIGLCIGSFFLVDYLFGGMGLIILIGVFVFLFLVGIVFIFIKILTEFN